MTKNKIKEVACKQLAESGYERATLSSIAKEVGIKTPSIYAFYKNKEDLFMAVYKDLLEDYYFYITNSVQNITDGTVKEKLYQIIKELCHYHLSQPEKTASYTKLAFVLPPTLNDDVRETFSEMEVVLSELLRDIFSKGIEQEVLKNQPVDDLIASFLCLMDGIFLELIYYQEAKFKRRVEQTWSIYWNGICKKLDE
ncbi:TetR family transcriptional regulator [Scopulibacillus darangshiensis]|uniref:TetR family transcriptional regulator n=1 Tax=Scopulibacillus darangshiensis TaxID=442528 RepID=A0A4R2P8N5_9BACL|nr:TetR/AcrR family transcriptional regulator [Scopulibacillus darangshiensis]TCP31339.1 TetR family transcriptional regulator [Scopulibacillus darangshiensis]